MVVCDVSVDETTVAGPSRVSLALNGQNFDAGGGNIAHLYLFYEQQQWLVDPGGGPINGGTVVTIFGRGLSGFDGSVLTARCLFEADGQSSLGPVLKISPSQLECSAPPAGTPLHASVKVALNGVHFVGAPGQDDSGCTMH